MPAPVAYIRRSAADAGSPGDISRTVQEQAIAQLAHREGHNGDVRYFVDWARSADEEKQAQRTEYAAMLRAVERGEVSTIYAYRLDRLLRSVVMTGKLLRAAKDAGVRIVTHVEGDLSDDGNPSKWLHTMILSTFSEYELRTVKQRAAGALARRRERGDAMGHAPYGYRHEREASGRIVTIPDPSRPLEPVLEAVREAGTVLGGARLLEARGVPAPKGGKRWSVSALTRILQREAPELLRPRGASGRRTDPPKSPLAGIIRCHCGGTMTPNVARGQLYCNRGHVQGAKAHGKMSVTVASLMPWLEAEAARLRTPDAVALGEASIEERASLTERRKRLGWAVADGLLDRDEAKAAAGEIDAALSALEAQEQVASIPAIDWTWPAPELNAALRALWERVELDTDMRPIRAAWRVPEWRS